MNLIFFETSAKTGSNIKSLFNELAKKLTGIETNPINNADEKIEPKGFSLNEKVSPGEIEGKNGGGKTKKKKSKCC